MFLGFYGNFLLIVELVYETFYIFGALIS